jgi:hypothetical protein
LSLDAARSLAKPIGRLSLRGLSALTPELAEAISRRDHYHELFLDGVTDMSQAVASRLSLFASELSLNGLASISVEVAEALSQQLPPRRYTDAAAGLSAEAREFLTESECPKLWLDGLVDLPLDAAICLAKHRGWISLNGLAEIKKDVAEALASHRGLLFLRGLKKLCAYSTIALRQSPNTAFPQR